MTCADIDVLRSPTRVGPVRRALVTVMALLCLAAGILSIPLPLPLGIVFFSIGFALLLTVSRRGRVWFWRLRRRAPWLDERIASVEYRLPDQLRRALGGGHRRQI